MFRTAGRLTVSATFVDRQLIVVQVRHEPADSLCLSLCFYQTDGLPMQLTGFAMAMITGINPGIKLIDCVTDICQS